MSVAAISIDMIRRRIFAKDQARGLSLYARQLLRSAILFSLRHEGRRLREKLECFEKFTVADVNESVGMILKTFRPVEN